MVICRGLIILFFVEVIVWLNIFLLCISNSYTNFPCKYSRYYIKYLLTLSVNGKSAGRSSKQLKLITIKYVFGRVHRVAKV